MKYKFKTDPYEHQLKALEMSWNRETYAYFMEMGTGKTKVLIDNAAMLYDKGKIDGLLIVAPKGVGKSEFVLGLLWSISTGNPFLDWEVPEAHPGNYIDFEMGRYDTTERLQKYQKRWGYGNDNYLKINQTIYCN